MTPINEGERSNPPSDMPPGKNPANSAPPADAPPDGSSPSKPSPSPETRSLHKRYPLLTFNQCPDQPRLSGLNFPIPTETSFGGSHCARNTPGSSARAWELLCSQANNEISIPYPGTSKDDEICYDGVEGGPNGQATAYCVAIPDFVTLKNTASQGAQKQRTRWRTTGTSGDKWIFEAAILPLSLPGMRGLMLVDCNHSYITCLPTVGSALRLGTASYEA
ncbi:MAG: hypothetical protein Q9166_006847 [cf. Caloplaca sp. 2 TL-2023]